MFLHLVLCICAFGDLELALQDHALVPRPVHAFAVHPPLGLQTSRCVAVAVLHAEMVPTWGAFKGFRGICFSWAPGNLSPLILDGLVLSLKALVFQCFKDHCSSLPANRANFLVAMLCFRIRVLLVWLMLQPNQGNVLGEAWQR